MRFDRRLGFGASALALTTLLSPPALVGELLPHTQPDPDLVAAPYGLTGRYPNSRPRANTGSYCNRLPHVDTDVPACYPNAFTHPNTPANSHALTNPGLHGRAHW